MTRIPFNYAEAVNGRPIYIGSVYKKPHKQYFIGMTRSGKVVLENECGIIYESDIKSIFHLPEKVIRYVNLYWDVNEKCVKSECNYSSYDSAVANIVKSNIHKYLKTIEIELDGENYEY